MAYYNNLVEKFKTLQITVQSMLNNFLLFVLSALL